MNTTKSVTALVLSLVLFSFLLSTSPVFAAEHESKGEGGASAYAKLETFTVNLHGLTQYLQVAITLKTATPEVSEKVKTYMPMIQHEMILLLSNSEADQIATAEGKNKLKESTKQAINKVIGLTEKQGITDVLFESFIIQ